MAERTISADELKKHSKQGDCWLAIHGNVYDVSDFMDDHPGGGDVLLDAAGAFRRARWPRAVRVLHRFVGAVPCSLR